MTCVLYLPELNSSKVAQAELDKTVKDLKESVNFGHGRIDQVELKTFKYDSALREAKEALEKKHLYLEAYSRRENLKFAGIPESEGESQEDYNKTSPSGVLIKPALFLPSRRN